MSIGKESITVIKTKPLKTTTSVQGILVQCSNKEWYAVLTLQPSRNPWFIRSVSATSTGRTNNGIEQFSMRCGGTTRPDVQRGIEMLLDALNGIEVPHDKIAY